MNDDGRGRTVVVVGGRVIVAIVLLLLFARGPEDRGAGGSLLPVVAALAA